MAFENINSIESASEALDQYFDSEIGVFSDNNIFYENQMNQTALTWRLINYKKGNTTFENGKVVLKGLLSDLDVSYSISNEWGSGSSGVADAIANLGNKAIDFGRQAGMTVKGIEKAVTDKQFGGVASYLKDAIGEGKNLLREAVGEELYDKVGYYFNKYTNSHVISSSKWVKVFQGTNIDITIPQLTVTLFDYSDRGKGSIIDVAKALNELQIGTLDQAAEIIGIQGPPNGFEATFSTIGSKERIPGTFSLEVGDKFVLHNLLMNKMDVKLSSIKRKHPDDKIIMPLYADISVNLEFATMITKDTLNDMVFNEFK